MPLPLLLLALAQDPDRVTAIMTEYREKTRATVECHVPDGDDEIVVCALRDADRYRVPLVAASNARNSVPLRTEALTRDYGRIPCGEGAIIAHCGPGFGVSASWNGADGVQLVRRDLAP